jgi:hypothetical protein
MSETWSARCRCGAFTAKMSSPPVLQLVCHCTDCRAVAGTPFSNFVFFRARDTLVEGTVAKREFVADSGHATVRECCAQCGDMLIDRTAGFPKVVGVVAERIEGPFTFTPMHHVWTDSKLPGVEIPAGVTAYPRAAAA